MADKKSELNEIKRDGGKPQKNSGRGKFQKGDALLFPFCIDIKEYRESFSLSRNVWAKACTDAWDSGRHIPALKVVLGEETSKVRLWVIDDAMMKELHEAWLEKYERNGG